MADIGGKRSLPQVCGKERWQERFERLSPLHRAERRSKIAATYRQKLAAKKKNRQLEEAKRVIELDRNLLVIVVLIVALPIIAALAAMLTFLAVSDGF